MSVFLFSLLLRPAVQSIVISISVCLSVCDCLSAHIIKTNVAELCILLMAVIKSSSGGVAIHYVRPVLRMTSFFHIMALWRAMYIPERRQNTTNITAEIPTTKFYSTIKTGSTHRDLRTRGEVCYLRLPYYFPFLVQYGRLTQRIEYWRSAPYWPNLRFLADRTIGRAFGTMSRLSVVCRLSVVRRL